MCKMMPRITLVIGDAMTYEIFFLVFPKIVSYMANV